jgi:alkylhydroperoxidase/carboxymuconolactone decarboxylase family protein YurZ
VEANLAVARQIGITEEELAETIQLAASVGAGSLTAMARRASVKSEPKESGKTLTDYLDFSG